MNRNIFFVCTVIIGLSLSTLTPLVHSQEVASGVHRTPDERFSAIDEYPFEPHYINVNGLRMHYVDEGTGAAGTMILLHGEPVWSYMYRKAIPELAAAGYRVIAPDNIGFGKSDKVIDLDWYTLDNHVETLEILIGELDLQNITIVVNDWGGPNGLILATEHFERFERLVILNTWLHHEGYEYTDALREWRVRSQQIDFSNRPGAEGAVQAPFDSQDAVAGALRWPWMLPFEQPEAGNATRQEQAFTALASWSKPAHVIFGEDDQVFPPEWGREFAAHIPGATFTIVPNEGHRPLLLTGGAGGCQVNPDCSTENRGDEFAALVLRLISEE